MCSFVDVLHEARGILEVLPPEALKNLTATCRNLRTQFREQVKVITLLDAADGSRLCCKTWPQLVMVVWTSSTEDLKSRLSAQWEYMMEVSLCWGPCSKTNYTSGSTNAILIRSRQQLHTLCDNLPTQHCAALSQFADKNRHSLFTRMTLRGPCVGYHAVQSLVADTWPQLNVFHVSGTLGSRFISHLSNLAFLQEIVLTGCLLGASALLEMGKGQPKLEILRLANCQLDADAISAITLANWPCLRLLDLSKNELGVAGVHHLVSCSWPLLQHLALGHACIDGPAWHRLAQGHWPKLLTLSLAGNSIGTAGISDLIQGNWPNLRRLTLSAQGVDQACLLLDAVKGITKAPEFRVIFVPQPDVNNTHHNRVSRLLCDCRLSSPQFQYLIIRVNKN